MPKPLKTRRISTPDRKGVFGQGAKALRVGLYARVSTHDQKTLPLQLLAMRNYAKKRSLAVAVEVKDVGSGATKRSRRETLIAAARREAGRVCGVRARYFAGPHEGGNRASKKGWETAWAARDSR